MSDPSKQSLCIFFQKRTSGVNGGGKDVWLLYIFCQYVNCQKKKAFWYKPQRKKIKKMCKSVVTRVAAKDISGCSERKPWRNSGPPGSWAEPERQQRMPDVNGGRRMATGFDPNLKPRPRVGGPPPKGGGVAGDPKIGSKNLNHFQICDRIGGLERTRACGESGKTFDGYGKITP